jgi:dolichol-phosphate mannosyltransferase|tara:strand:- start:182 stop:1279 length:1098 start_codon:yes stop_codon:yes gene_type:complete
MLSVIAPTYKEVDHIEPFARALHQVLVEAGISFELLIVDDDSCDGTEQKAAQLARELPLAFHCRVGERRDLSESVLDCIDLACNDMVVVMHCDPRLPAEIPELIKPIQSGGADLVIGSRSVAGGSFDRSGSFWRFSQTRFATLLAKPLVSCADPMSGFFALNRLALPKRADLHPVGGKIALEIMVRAESSRVLEVPIHSVDRVEEAMSLTEQFDYLRHLRRLYLHRFPGPAELVNFVAVGASGFIIDVTFYYLLQLLGIEHRMARAISFWPAVTSNWFLNRTTTFSYRGVRPRLRQWAEFAISCLIGFCVSWGSYFVLTTFIDFFDRYRLLALLLGAAMGTVFNFTIASLYVYSAKRTDNLSDAK